MPGIGLGLIDDPVLVSDESPAILLSVRRIVAGAGCGPVYDYDPADFGQSAVHPREARHVFAVDDEHLGP